MTQVAPEFAPADASHAEIASWLGLATADIVRAECVSTGISWLIAQLSSFDAMLRVQPNALALDGKEISTFCVGSDSSEVSIRVRTFAPAKGVFEDPVTGSSNGCIAAFIAKYGLLPARDGEITYVAEQGIEMGQPGRVYCRVTGTSDAMSVQVGGYAVTVLRGELLLPA
jgi:PhzF family phenazine biosynthesis protein